MADLPRLLALDVANSTGWAVIQDGRILRSGAVQLVSAESRELLRAVDKHTVETHRTASVALYQVLLDLVKEFQPALVVSERPYFQRWAPQAGAFLFSMRGVVLLVSLLTRKAYFEVEPTAWQAWARQFTDWKKRAGPHGLGDQQDAEAIALWAEFNILRRLINVSDAGTSTSPSTASDDTAERIRVARGARTTHRRTGGRTGGRSR